MKDIYFRYFGLRLIVAALSLTMLAHAATTIIYTRHYDIYKPLRCTQRLGLCDQIITRPLAERSVLFTISVLYIISVSFNISVLFIISVGIKLFPFIETQFI